MSGGNLNANIYPRILENEMNEHFLKFFDGIFTPFE